MIKNKSINLVLLHALKYACIVGLWGLICTSEIINQSQKSSNDFITSLGRLEVELSSYKELASERSKELFHELAVYQWLYRGEESMEESEIKTLSNTYPSNVLTEFSTVMVYSGADENIKSSDFRDHMRESPIIYPMFTQMYLSGVHDKLLMYDFTNGMEYMQKELSSIKDEFATVEVKGDSNSILRFILCLVLITGVVLFDVLYMFVSRQQKELNT